MSEGNGKKGIAVHNDSNADSENRVSSMSMRYAGDASSEGNEMSQSEGKDGAAGSLYDRRGRHVSMTGNRAPADKQLTRVVIAADLCSKAEFSDGSVLLLDASGMCAALVDPATEDMCYFDDNENTMKYQDDNCSAQVVQASLKNCTKSKTMGPLRRFMSTFALKRHQGKLAAALAVRNAVAEPICVCPAVVKSNGGVSFSSSEKIKIIHWPDSTSTGFRDKRIEINDLSSNCENSHDTDGFSDTGSTNSASMSVGEGDGSIVIKSYGDVASMILTGDGLRFLVRFPVEVKEDVVARCTMQHDTTLDDISTASNFQSNKCRVGSYHYMWLVQSFSTSTYPARWIPVVELAMQVLAQCKNEKCETLLPDSKQRITKIPTANRNLGSGSLPNDKWWLSSSTTFYPKNYKLWLEWRPDASMTYLEKMNEVEVVLAADGSVLRSDQNGKFFHHFRRCINNKTFEERIISATAIPPSANTFAGNYHIESIVRRACIFLNAVGPSLNKPEDEGSPKYVDPFSSTKVIARQTLDGVGVFTLYEYGRVHVKFADRTILNLFDEKAMANKPISKITTPTSLCDIILPHGDRVKVRPSNPIGVEVYVNAALHFLQWVTQSEEEREAHVLRQQAIHAEIERNKRTCAIVGTMQISHTF